MSVQAVEFTETVHKRQRSKRRRKQRKRTQSCSPDRSSTKQTSCSLFQGADLEAEVSNCGRTSAASPPPPQAYDVEFVTSYAGVESVANRYGYDEKAKVGAGRRHAQHEPSHGHHGHR